MRIVFAGTPETAIPSLHALATGGAGKRHEVVGVITRQDAPLGRKRVLTPSMVAQSADTLGLPVFKTNRLDEAATDWVRSLQADLGVIVAYGGLVREPLLSLPRLGWINLHFSELPLWRGAAPVQRALMAGEQRLGLTVFRLVEALDAGEVLTLDRVDFAAGVPAESALQRLAGEGASALCRAVDLLDREPGAGTPQQGEPSYAHKLSREDGRLDLRRPAAEVLSHWAGVTSEPGAYVELDGQPLKLHGVRPTVSQEPGFTPLPGGEPAPVGTVHMVEGRAILHLSDGALQLERVQPAGKPVMDGADWLRGRGGSAVLS